MYVRSDHSALNTLLQSAGALLCKSWAAEVERIMVEDLGYIQGWEGDFALMAYSHDELQGAFRNREIAEVFTRVSSQAMTNTEKAFNFRVKLEVESKIGSNWSECH